MKFSHHPTYPQHTTWFMLLGCKDDKRELLYWAIRKADAMREDAGFGDMEDDPYIERTFQKLRCQLFEAHAMAWFVTTEAGRWLIEHKVGFDFRDWTVRVHRKEHAMLFKLTWC